MRGRTTPLWDLAMNGSNEERLNVAYSKEASISILRYLMLNDPNTEISQAATKRLEPVFPKVA